MEVQQKKSFRYAGLVIVLVDFMMRLLEVVSGVGSGVEIGWSNVMKGKVKNKRTIIFQWNMYRRWVERIGG